VVSKSNVVVDVGNSKIKTAVFEGDSIVQKFEAENLQQVKSHYSSVDHRFIFSSVRKDQGQIEQLFGEYDWILLNYNTPLPIQLKYKTPETLGVDRIAAVVGAYSKYKGQSLVIDAGTCITYDLVNDQGEYLGGVIAPGLKMRMQAMGQFTQALPDISDEWQNIEIALPGKSTKECLVNGAFTAMICEINGFINQFTADYGQMNVILTGGDAPYFESKLKAHIFADFDLVLTGLNRILNYNK